MDTSNWRPTEGVSGVVGEPTMESGDWRTQLQRQRIVNEIMDTFKRHLPFSGYEKLHELKKIAERVEEEIYTAVTTQSKYSLKTCFMSLTMETRLQSLMLDPMQSDSAANSLNPSVPFDPMAETGNPIGGDWQEEVYQKIEAMKDLYLLNLRPIQDTNGVVGDANHSVESGDWRAQIQADARQRAVNIIVDCLKRHLLFSGNEELKKIAERYEEKIYTVATSQSDYLRKISLKLMTMETGSQYPMLYSMHSNSVVNSVNPSVALYSTGNPNGGDWQEEVYQKIKDMKDLYLQDLNNIHQRVLSKLQKYDSLSQQQKDERHEKLKAFKIMLEHYIQFLQTPKHEISANYKNKVDAHEIQIINVVNSNRQTPTTSQQQ